MRVRYYHGVIGAYLLAAAIFAALIIAQHPGPATQARRDYEAVRAQHRRDSVYEIELQRLIREHGQP